MSEPFKPGEYFGRVLPGGFLKIFGLAAGAGGGGAPNHAIINDYEDDGPLVNDYEDGGFIINDYEIG